MTLSIRSSDAELMAEYESLRKQACGEQIGYPSDTPAEAVTRACETNEVPGMETIRTSSVIVAYGRSSTRRPPPARCGSGRAPLRDNLIPRPPHVRKHRPQGAHDGRPCAHRRTISCRDGRDRTGLGRRNSTLWRLNPDRRRPPETRATQPALG